MTLRHYGGRTPTVDAEWTCPSCALVQTGPLKAGCQQCGAGADAKQVGLERVAPQPATVHTAGSASPRGQAFQDWSKTVEHLQTPSVWALLEEAFMAGVAWAQAQGPRVRPGDIVLPHDAVLFTGSSEAGVTSPVTGQEYLYLTERQALTDTSVDQTVLQTILAALAFYRDNQLGYGPVPGQLTAEQVSALIARLSPQETEA